MKSTRLVERAVAVLGIIASVVPLSPQQKPKSTPHYHYQLVDLDALDGPQRWVFNPHEGVANSRGPVLAGFCAVVGNPPFLNGHCAAIIDRCISGYLPKACPPGAKVKKPGIFCGRLEVDYTRPCAF